VGSVTATTQAGVVIVAAMFAPVLYTDKRINYLSVYIYNEALVLANAIVSLANLAHHLLSIFAMFFDNIGQQKIVLRLFKIQDYLGELMRISSYMNEI